VWTSVHASVAALAIFVGLLPAQALRLPTINPGGIVNAASFLPPTLPGGAIAQGSIFSIFGADLGPKGLEARELPLQGTLGGVQIEILASDGRRFNALPLFVSTIQVNAVMPSEVPIGEHRLRVVRDGATGPLRTFKVVKSSPGLFVQARDGLPRFAVAQLNEPDDPGLLTRNEPGRPGEIITIWATGLGPVAVDQGPAQSIESDIEVWVGGRQAEVLFNGRSSCCVGLDQINVRIPEGPEGCRVPVRAVSGGATSGDVTLAVSGGSACGPEESFPVRVHLTRSERPDGFDESASALFPGYLERTDPMALPSRGSCLGQPGFPTNRILVGIVGPEIISFQGPLGGFMTRRSMSYILDPRPVNPVIGPGAYTVDGRGGDGLPFVSSLNVPERLAWAGDVDFLRENGITIEWGSRVGTEDVIIQSRSGENPIDLVCRASAADGQFHIPTHVLANLAAGLRTITVSNYVDAPLEFPTDGPETGLFIVTQERVTAVEADPPRLPSTPISLPGGEIVHAELATSFSESQRGLMFRTVLAPDRGMLFLYTRPGVYFFWMFRTLIPLDIIWLDSDRRIIFINADTPPCPPELGTGCPTYGPSARSQFILELGAGEAARRGLEVGDRLEW